MAELKIAIVEEQLELYYQPKVSLSSEKTVSLEALIRWNHPDHGLLGPDKFIDFAEETAIIHDLTHWVLERSIAFLVRLLEMDYDLSISVNISARNLLEEDFVDQTIALLNQYKLDPNKLILEVVESAMMEDIDLTIATLNRLHEAGIQLSIDDFGTGYSSLEYLKKLPLHELKIDRSFVSEMDDDDDDKVIVSTTLVIAHQLGMRVVAEGIEEERTAITLNEMGCEVGQGYHIARPMRELDVIEFLREKPWPGSMCTR